MGKKNPNPKKAGKSQLAKVTDADKARLLQILERFRCSETKEYKFDEELDTNQRAYVHGLCRRLGMTSKSKGSGKQRRISIVKRDQKRKSRSTKSQTEKAEVVPTLAFSKEGREVLHDLFVKYPPEGENTYKESVGTRRGTARKPKQSGVTDMFMRPVMKKGEIERKVQSLASKWNSCEKLRQINKQRARLPILTFKDEITSTVASHQVVLISGETGCGKTTQVPQFLLDSMWGKGESCKILCSQPRRISAISVAERIAAERGESIGENIGYKIRNEGKGGKHSSVVLCTTGILLRILVSNGIGAEAKKKTTQHEISEMTHIIMDEIHERDRFSDFMMTILRDMLPSFPHLRLILMSATLDSERFSEYFGGCPIIRVPGFTYPVQTYYLEDALSLLKSKGEDHLDEGKSCAPQEELKLGEEDRVALDEAIDLAWSDDEFDILVELVSTKGTPSLYNYQHSQSGLTPFMVFSGKGRVGEVCMLLSFGADYKLRANDGSTALELAEKNNQIEVAEVLQTHMERSVSNSDEQEVLLEKYHSKINPELIDIVLIETLIEKICTDSEDGAILVFFPGWDEISKTRTKLRANPLLKDESKFNILSLHSMIPTDDQKKVFERSPRGCRKIVLSTNIAETSITIDDVVYVIDTGRSKEKNYDPHSNVNTLQSSWVSKASAKQREGRAGRCQPGICYHLFSRAYLDSMPEFQIPEIRRMPMEELCLQVKLLDPDCKINDFLQKTLDPPDIATIRNGITILEDIGALSPGEKLTELGAKLGLVPLHPTMSKMLLFAVLMNCLDPALTMACAQESKDPFIFPMITEQKKKASDAKLKLASLLGGRSDQLAVVAAFQCWRNAKGSQQSKFCKEYFVSFPIMQMISDTRKQILRELQQNGFISGNVADYSLNARNPGILHAVLVAGLYPKVGKVLPTTSKDIRTHVETANARCARIHPSSVNSKLLLRDSGCPIVVFDESVLMDSGLVIRKCTYVSPLPLMFCSTEIAVAPASDVENCGSDSDDESEEDSDDHEEAVATRKSKKNRLMESPEDSVMAVVDRWLYFKSTALDVAQIYLLKERLSDAILFMVKHPNQVLPPVLGSTVYAIACILSFDGMSGISPLSQPESGKASAADTSFKPDQLLLSLFLDDDKPPHNYHSGGSRKNHFSAHHKNRGGPPGIQKSRFGT